MPTSVYGPGFHSSGKFRVSTDDADFGFWVWLVTDKKPMRQVGGKESPTVHGSDLEALRHEYYSRPTGANKDGTTEEAHVYTRS